MKCSQNPLILCGIRNKKILKTESRKYNTMELGSEKLTVFRSCYTKSETPSFSMNSSLYISTFGGSKKLTVFRIVLYLEQNAEQNQTEVRAAKCPITAATLA